MSVTSSKHAGDRREFVLGTADLDLRDGAAHQAAQQHAAEAVADAGTETTLERFGDELAVGCRKCVAVDFQTCWAVPCHANEYASSLDLVLESDVGGLCGYQVSCYRESGDDRLFFRAESSDSITGESAEVTANQADQHRADQHSFRLVASCEDDSRCAESV